MPFTPTRMPRAKQRGLALVWTVLVLMILLGLTGLALDTGYVVLTGQQLQNAADAAALAGARHASNSPEDARLAAIEIAAYNTAGGGPVTLIDNPGNDPAGDVVIGQFDRDSGTFTAQLSP